MSLSLDTPIHLVEIEDNILFGTINAALLAWAIINLLLHEKSRLFFVSICVSNFIKIGLDTLHCFFLHSSPSSLFLVWRQSTILLFEGINNNLLSMLIALNYFFGRKKCHFLMFMKNPKNGPFWQVFENLKNSVTSQVSFNRIKIGGKCQNSTRHFGWFSNNVFSTFTFMQRKIKVFLESNFSNNVSLDLLANGT